MKLHNRFTNEEKEEVWGDFPYCALCGYNQHCSIHHIDSTTSDSIYNSIILCHAHHMIADTHNTQSPLSKDYRKNLRKIAHNRVVKSGHINNKNDEAYFDKHRTNITEPDVQGA